VKPALEDASEHAFRVGIAISGFLALAGGLISLVGIEPRRREVHAESCPGGAICGAGEEVRLPAVTPRRLPARASS
jgi:hypothetical protein